MPGMPSQAPDQADRKCSEVLQNRGIFFSMYFSSVSIPMSVYLCIYIYIYIYQCIYIYMYIHQYHILSIKYYVQYIIWFYIR